MEQTHITTTCGETFSYADSREMARLVFRRFGRDSAAALSAWRRLLQNSCTLEQFFDLVGRDWMNESVLGLVVRDG